MNFNLISIFLLTTITTIVLISRYIIRNNAQSRSISPPYTLPLSTLIFDFDGTIANTYTMLFDITNKYAMQYGYKKISEEDYQRFRAMHAYTIAQELNISLLKLPFIIKNIQMAMRSTISSAKPYSAITEILLTLKKDGYQLGIVTSNSKENVKLFLKKNDLEIFDFIYTAHNFFGKESTLKKVLRHLGIKPHQALYVGDEARDVQAAQKSSLKIIAVTWGYNNRIILEKTGAEYLIDHPDELYKIIQHLTIK